MEWILGFIIVLIVAYFICAPKIEIIREFKIKRQQSRREGNLSERGMTKGAKAFQFMIVSSIIITIIVFYITKVEYSISTIAAGTLTILIFESIIGSFLAFIQEAILRYKKDGFIKATITLVISIIIIIGIMYVKYKNLISK